MYLALVIPRHAVRMGLLEEKPLCGQLIDEARVVLINNGKFLSAAKRSTNNPVRPQLCRQANVQLDALGVAPCTEIKATDGRLLLDQLHREWVINEDLENLIAHITIE